MRHINIPIFIPHYGCGHSCVFCNQIKITGCACFDPAEVDNTIKNALSTASYDDEVEIAFFGGSFTGIPRDEIEELLRIANKYVLEGKVTSLRCSTRPDYIDNGILELLARYGMTTVELGIQSMDNAVLSACKRGHDASCSERAATLIKEHGMNFVGQMMIGLPCSTLDSEITTAKKICALGAAGARIYPTAVFANTALAKMAEEGLYLPLSLEEAIAHTAEVMEIFIENSVPIIRIGLCESDNIHESDGIIAGAFHPALGELCESEMLLKRFDAEISELKKGADITVRVAPSSLSKAIGQHRKNINALKEKHSPRSLRIIPDKQLTGYEFYIEQKD